jgi:hypothetical protein
MKKKQEIIISSIEYRNDEAAKNKLIEFVIDCLLDNYLGGGESGDGESYSRTGL